MTAKTNLACSIAAAAALLLSTAAGAAAQFVIVNGDRPGEGFNDPTPIAPVGGNPGLTLGQQRLNAFAYAASIWGSKLNSNSPIRVLATFDPRPCTDTGAVLGSAGTTNVFRDPSDFPKTDTWYPFALANKLVGLDIAEIAGPPLFPGYPHIRAIFNSNLGNPGCLTGSPFYLGLDNSPPVGQVNLVVTLLHELGHGLGFQSFTSGTTGAFLGGYPAIWDHYLFDNTIGKNWLGMTNAERAFSAVNPRRVVWAGQQVTFAAPTVLSLGTPELSVLAPAALQGSYLVGTASFGPALDSPGLTRQVALVVDQANGTGLACDPLNKENVRRVKQRIALIDRGTCGFTQKVKNAQDAGAVGVIIVDNVVGSPPAGLGGSDPTITIPAVRIALDDGNAIRSAIKSTPSDRSSGVVVRVGVDRSQLNGADELDRVMVYTPSLFSGGSSVSHWDTSATRNQLMEPSISLDLTQSVMPPEDLTLPLFRDIGW